MTAPLVSPRLVGRVPLASNGSVTWVTPGVVDDEAVTAYTRGQCMALARAIAGSTSLPVIGAFYDVPEEAVSIDALLLDGDDGGFIHAGVLVDGTKVLDINGLADRHGWESDLASAWGETTTFWVLDGLDQQMLGRMCPDGNSEVAGAFARTLLRDAGIG